MKKRHFAQKQNILQKQFSVLRKYMENYSVTRYSQLFHLQTALHISTKLERLLYHLGSKCIDRLCSLLQVQHVSHVVDFPTTSLTSMSCSSTSILLQLHPCLNIIHPNHPQCCWNTQLIKFVFQELSWHPLQQPKGEQGQSSEMLGWAMIKTTGMLPKLDVCGFLETPNQPQQTQTVMWICAHHKS